ncbi:MAG: hypothetical protein RSD22_05985 [Romboutsia sp.]
MNEKYFNKDIDDKKFYHSVLKNCTNRIENQGIIFPITTDESKKELNEVIGEIVWDMFYNYRPQPNLQIISTEIAEDFYNVILELQDVELALQRICEEKDLDVVVITELSL